MIGKASGYEKALGGKGKSILLRARNTTKKKSRSTAKRGSYIFQKKSEKRDGGQDQKPY